MRSLIFTLSFFVLATGCGDDAPPAHSGGSGSGGTSSSGGSSSSGGAGPGGTSAGTAQSGGSGGAQSGSGGSTGGTSPGAGGSSGGSDASGGSGGSGGGDDDMHWVGTWATGPQATEMQNEPPDPGLPGNTLRQIVRVSIGGNQLRLRLSNEYGTAPVTFNAVHVAKPTTGSSIDTSTDLALTFNGSPSVTVPAQQAVTSDPFQFPLEPLSKVAITIAFGDHSGPITGHPGSRTTSYLMAGNHPSAASISGAQTDHWYFISNIDVLADASAAAIAILGDSITDGRGSTTNGNDRWPDILANRLQEDMARKNVAVLNLGIGGNWLRGPEGLGPPGIERFQTQILGQSGVRWVVVLEGVNDIGGGVPANLLIETYNQMIQQAHAAGLLIYGIPILPFAGHADYDKGDNQQDRNLVNDFIRTPGNFDAYLPLDEAVSDGMTPPGLRTDLDFQDDRLHLNPQGLAALANAIDLTLFTP